MEFKIKRLTEELQRLGSAAVAYSGGVDSTFLLYMSKKVLGDRAVGIMNVTQLVSSESLESARNVAKQMGIDILEITAVDDRILSNPSDRCYICKTATLKGIILKAKELNIPNVIDGTIVDDDSSFRPGMKALEELKIHSPLRDAGFTKKDVIAASRMMNLPHTRSETCLATRIPYDTSLTAENLKAVELSEMYIHSLGIEVCRVRHHGSIARIEVSPRDMGIVLSNGEEVSKKLKEIGFEYVCLDLNGYKSGSMDKRF